MSDDHRQQILDLYQGILTAWNARDAGAFGEKFVADGHAVGFDGSQMDGREAIIAALRPIFSDHPTATYVAKVREVKQLASSIVLLRGIAGMLPPGQSALKPEVNAIQTLVATKTEEGFRAMLFQSTPAAFHGRPELVRAMTDELTHVVESGRVVEGG